jgi:N-acetylneuraminic acid mutarotase
LTADPTARNGSCSGVINGLLYGSDGNDNSNGPVSLMESFSLTANKWTTLLAMPQTVTDAGSAVYQGQLYCFGGGNNGGPPNNTVYNYVQIYQP